MEFQSANDVLNADKKYVEPVFSIHPLRKVSSF